MKDRSADHEPEELETALLVALQPPSTNDEKIEESLGELSALARTAGARVAGTIVQKRKNYDPSTLLGKGKVDEVKRSLDAAGASMVIFENELSMTQQDRLQSSLGAKVIGRTALILDIFAQHAHTKEGRTQVELAQLSYLLPRIRGRGVELSRLGGGIGTRGPGETKLEEDRRRIRKRMGKLERDLRQMELVRSTQRKKRTRAGLPSICLVGYTNSGKSSLLNRLTGSTVLVEDQLFSTLDSTTRRLKLPERQQVVLSDTVGFIKNLPHELVAAFRSTLEVVREADLLVHVIDSSRQQGIDERIHSVLSVLEDLSVSDLPLVTVFNKVDLLDESTRSFLERPYPGALMVSAVSGEGLGRLSVVLEESIAERRTYVIRVPLSRGDILSGIHRDGSIEEEEHGSDSITMTVRMNPAKASKYSDYLVRDGINPPITTNMIST